MDGRVPKQVFDACHGDVTSIALFALLDMSGSLTQAQMAERLGVSVMTVRRSLERLRKRDIVTGSARVGFELAYVKSRLSVRTPVNTSDDLKCSPENTSECSPVQVTDAKRAPENTSRARAHAGERLFQEIPITKELTTSSSTSDQAREITKLVWDQREHPPATKFIAVLKIAQRFVEAGWPQEAIVRAMVSAPTISIGWVESALTREAKTKPKSNVSTERDLPRGRIEL